MKRTFLLLVLVAAILGSSAILLPGSYSQDKIIIAISITIFLLGIMASWFFLTSLQAFKKELRIAYYILTAGVLTFGLSQILLPIGSIIDLGDLFAILIVLTYVISMIIIYAGVRKFARLLSIHSPWRSFWLTIGFSLLIGFVIKLVPLDAGAAELLYDVIYGGFLTGGAFGFAAAFLALSIRKKLGPNYKSAMSWLAAGLLIAAIAPFHEEAIRLLLVGVVPEWYYDYGINLWTYVLATILFLGASLSFRQISRQFGAIPENATYLDVIQYVARQVSDPTEIDVTLDKVREITARKSSTALSNAEKTELLVVYSKIETYLLTKEPLRKITKDELRLKLPDDFRQALDA